MTPLGLDLTHTRLIGELVDWQVGNFVHEAIERAKSNSAWTTPGVGGRRGCGERNELGGGVAGRW